MECIAEALNVSHQTIGRDLEGLSIVDKPPRPKGGRPKGSVAASLLLPQDRPTASIARYCCTSSRCPAVYLAALGFLPGG
jgi:hypothetical protein